MDTSTAPPCKAAVRDAKQQKQHLKQLIECEWSELPYAMMRITAARRPWDGNRVYWRDRIVQLGDVDLNLINRDAENVTPSYRLSTRLKNRARSSTSIPRSRTINSVGPRPESARCS